MVFSSVILIYMLRSVFSFSKDTNSTFEDMHSLWWFSYDGELGAFNWWEAT